MSPSPRYMVSGIMEQLGQELKTAVGHSAVFPRARNDEKDPQRAVNYYLFTGGMRFLGMACEITDNDHIFQIDVYGRSSKATTIDYEAIMERFKDNRLEFFDDPNKKWWNIGVRLMRFVEEEGLYHGILHLSLSRCYI